MNTQYHNYLHHEVDAENALRLAKLLSASSADWIEEEGNAFSQWAAKSPQFVDQNGENYYYIRVVQRFQVGNDYHNQVAMASVVYHVKGDSVTPLGDIL